MHDYKESEQEKSLNENELEKKNGSYSYDFFVAYQTDKFLSGTKESDLIKNVDYKKLLEIRLFSETGELLARRTMIGSNNKFQWRIADEEKKDKDKDYIIRYQTLDIDTTLSSKKNNGNLELFTTGSGKYELPISEEHNRIKIISYIDYDDDGMAFIYDDRLVSFEKGGQE